MKKRLITRHPVAELASLLLFGIFVLFLLLMLLFSARIYQQTVKNTNAENTLGTAVSYLTTKFRQHDTVNGIFTGKLDNLSALCFRDTLNDQDYITYIYLDQGNLKELFTSDSSSANASAGTTIAQLSDWQGCPGTMIYRRDIAKEVFGTDDPAEVQKKVADWDTFKATAEELKEKGTFFRALV